MPPQAPPNGPPLPAVLRLLVAVHAHAGGAIALTGAATLAQYIRLHRILTGHGPTSGTQISSSSSSSSSSSPSSSSSSTSSAAANAHPYGLTPTTATTAAIATTILTLVAALAHRSGRWDASPAFGNAINALAVANLLIGGGVMMSLPIWGRVRTFGIPDGLDGFAARARAQMAETGVGTGAGGGVDEDAVVRETVRRALAVLDKIAAEWNVTAGGSSALAVMLSLLFVAHYMKREIDEYQRARAAHMARAQQAGADAGAETGAEADESGDASDDDALDDDGSE